MHFSIPETVECTSKDGTCYVGYHIRINGLHHCTLRYKQLRHLHQQLQRVYGSDSLPEFPPKKFLPLTPVQAEDRRLQLEKYLQIVAQDPRIKNGALFPAFLHLAQSETHLPQQDADTFDLQVSLPGDETIVISVAATDQTDTTIKLIGQQIRLKEDLLGYFGLFVYEINKHNKYLLTRKLLKYESPCLTLRLSGDQARLVFRKTYWDPADDEDLIHDPVGLKLVYSQMLDDIKRNWISPADNKQRELLKRWMNEHRKEECVRLGRTMRFYGGVVITDCELDYPCAGTQGSMHVNSKELTFIGPCEMVFRVTRIRSWRMTTLLDTKNPGETKQPPKLELSFEYLLSKDRLHWITVTSEQLILLSLCLQSLVEELVRKQAGESSCSSSSSLQVNDEITSELTYMRQDGAIQPLTNSQSPSCKEKKYSPGRIHDRRDSMLVRFRNGKSQGRADAFVENSAFNDIRDEDL